MSRTSLLPPRTLGALSLALLLVGCAASAPQFEADPSADLAALKRFAYSVAPTPGAPLVPLDSEIFQKRVRLGVVAALTGNGYLQDEATPEFHVRSHLLVKQNAKAAPRIGFSLGTGSYGGSVGTAVSVGGSTDVGKAQDQLTLVIEIRDAKSDELLWQGWREVGKAIGDPTSAALDQEIQAILSDFPLPAGKAHKQKR